MTTKTTKAPRSTKAAGKNKAADELKLPLTTSEQQDADTQPAKKDAEKSDAADATGLSVKNEGAVSNSLKADAVNLALDILKEDKSMAPTEGLSEALALMVAKKTITQAQNDVLIKDEALKNVLRTEFDKLNQQPGDVTTTKPDGSKVVEKGGKDKVAKKEGDEKPAGEPKVAKKDGEAKAPAAKKEDANKPEFFPVLKVGKKDVPVSLRVTKENKELLELLLNNYPVELVQKVNYFTLTYKGTIVWTVERTQDPSSFTFLTNRADKAVMLPLYEKFSCTQQPEGFYYDKGTDLEVVKTLADAHWATVLKRLG